MSKIYVIVERGYEYNDEVYSSQEGGNAVHAYSNLETATAACLERSIDMLCDNWGAECILMQYDSPFKESNEIKNICVKYNVDYEKLYDYEILQDLALLFKKMPRDDARIFARNLKTLPFFVQSVDLS